MRLLLVARRGYRLGGAPVLRIGQRFRLVAYHRALAGGIVVLALDAALDKGGNLMSKWHFVWILLLGYALGYWLRKPGDLTLGRIYKM